MNGTTFIWPPRSGQQRGSTSPGLLIDVINIAYVWLDQADSPQELTIGTGTERPSLGIARHFCVDRPAFRAQVVPNFTEPLE